MHNHPRAAGSPVNQRRRHQPHNHNQRNAKRRQRAPLQTSIQLFRRDAISSLCARSAALSAMAASVLIAYSTVLSTAGFARVVGGEEDEHQEQQNEGGDGEELGHGLLTPLPCLLKLHCKLFATSRLLC